MTQELKNCQTNKELLPCPFCGGRAAQFDGIDRENKKSSSVICLTCACKIFRGDGLREDAIAQWNTRATACLLKNTDFEKQKDLSATEGAQPVNEELLTAIKAVEPLFAVDCPEDPDEDCVGWVDHTEIPVTFGQIRRLYKAIANAEVQLTKTPENVTCENLTNQDERK